MGYEGGQGGTFSRDDQRALRCLGRTRGRDYAGYRTKAPVQGQFAEEFMLLQALPGHLSRGRENSQGNRQVKASALFG